MSEEMDLGSASAVRRLSVNEIDNLNKNDLKKAMLTLMNKEAEKINKPEMKKALLALLKCENDPSETTNALTKIQQSVDTVEKQLSTLKNQMLSVENKINSNNGKENFSNEMPVLTHGASLSGVMRQSVGAALQEERCRHDIIVSRAAEGDDAKMINDLCKLMDFPTQPNSQRRLGQKKDNNVRLLMLSFGSSFDARAFKSRYEHCKTEKKVGLPSLRLRIGKTKEEREHFKQSASLCHRLNQDAKTAKRDESFSLRDNGSVWKYVKCENGAWKRVKSWTTSELPSSLTATGNATASTTGVASPEGN